MAALHPARPEGPEPEPSSTKVQFACALFLLGALAKTLPAPPQRLDGEVPEVIVKLRAAKSSDRDIRRMTTSLALGPPLTIPKIQKP